MSEEPRLYFRQLLSGHDFARGDQVAEQMVNFCYLIGDRATGEALVVDPSYDPAGLLEVLAADDMRLVGALATHYHADHIGGPLMGSYHIDGIAQLLEVVDVPIHVQADEVPWIERQTGVSDQLVAHASGDTVAVGEVEVTLIHTPGHTPGSQCFFVDGALVSGDTLFLDGCGRTDLPGSDPVAMYESLTQRLAKVPDDALLFPGHRYSPAPYASMAETRARNFVLAPRSVEDWLQLFG
jgi:glyoxylase-like metal-dependent hydrolase (beta-lactamase superfamily II)